MSKGNGEAKDDSFEANLDLFRAKLDLATCPAWDGKTPFDEFAASPDAIPLQQRVQECEQRVQESGIDWRQEHKESRQPGGWRHEMYERLVGNRDNQRKRQVTRTTEAENSIVANMLLWPETLDACEGLQGKHFQNKRLGEAFDAIREARDHGLVAADQLLSQGWKTTHLATLADQAISPTLSAEYASRIMEAHQAGQLYSALTDEALDITSDTPGASVQTRIERLQERLGTIIPQDEQTSSAHVQEIAASLMHELEDGDDVIPTGFLDLDAKIRGWPLGTLSLLAGRPGMGKTATLLNAAGRLAASGVPTLVVCLEDRREQHLRRILSVESGVPLSLITHEGIYRSPKETQISLAIATRKLIAWPLYILEGPMTARQICRVARQYVDRHGVRAILVDHAQEIQPDDDDRRDQRTYEVQAATQKLCDLAVQTKTAVVLAAQINREAEKAKRPMISHLRDSGSLEQIARLVLLLYRDEYYNENSEDKGILEVIVGKANHGPSGGEPVKLRWDGECCKVEDLSRRYP